MAHITHFAHPSHELSEHQFSQFICDGCDKRGRGRGYACIRCNFVLHPSCATCPREATLRQHRQHKLVLKFRRTQGGPYCDICYSRIKGLYYTCNHCDYDVHLTCAVESLERDEEEREQIVSLLRFQVATVHLLAMLRLSDSDSD